MIVRSPTTSRSNWWVFAKTQHIAFALDCVSARLAARTLMSSLYTHVVHNNLVLLPSVEVEELDVACFAAHFLLWHEVCELTGIDTTSSISRHASTTSSNTCALRTTRGGCCTGTVCLFTDGCAVQIPSAPLGHCLLADNVVPSAEPAVGFATKR